MFYDSALTLGGMTEHQSLEGDAITLFVFAITSLLILFTGISSSLRSMHALGILRRFATNDTLYEAAWKASDFTLPEDSADDFMPVHSHNHRQLHQHRQGFHRSIYRALSAISKTNQTDVLSIVDDDIAEARMSLLNDVGMGSGMSLAMGMDVKKLVHGLVAIAHMEHRSHPHPGPHFHANDLCWSVEGVLLRNEDNAQRLQKHYLHVVRTAREKGMMARARLELRRLTHYIQEHSQEQHRFATGLEDARLLFLDGHVR